MSFSKKVIRQQLSTQDPYPAQLHPEADWSTRQVATIIGVFAGAAVIPGIFSLQALAQTMFPDVSADYWAQPFIEALAQQGILEGYPDGTFRPEEIIDRDEYAAVIRRAFEASPERTLDSASTLSDVPEGYWAAPAIEEAYETGFMGLPEANEFEPQTEVSRAEAILALVNGLDLSQPTAGAVAAVPTTTPAQPQPVKSRRGTPFHLANPIASTELMRIFAPPAAAPPAQETSAPVAAANTAPRQAAIDLSQYYADASEIPAYAQDQVALATQLGLVVNYPDVRLLNPLQPISRGGTAALVYQALVYENELEPLPESSAAAIYIVPGTTTASE